MIHGVATKCYWFLGGFVGGGIIGFLFFRSIESIFVIGFMGGLGSLLASITPLPHRGR